MVNNYVRPVVIGIGLLQVSRLEVPWGHHVDDHQPGVNADPAVLHSHICPQPVNSVCQSAFFKLQKKGRRKKKEESREEQGQQQRDLGTITCRTNSSAMPSMCLGERASTTTTVSV